jgi:hypothetical protein
LYYYNEIYKANKLQGEKVYFGSWFWRSQSKIKQSFCLGPLARAANPGRGIWQSKLFVSQEAMRNRKSTHA